MWDTQRQEEQSSCFQGQRWIPGFWFEHELINPLKRGMWASCRREGKPMQFCVFTVSDIQGQYLIISVLHMLFKIKIVEKFQSDSNVVTKHPYFPNTHLGYSHRKWMHHKWSVAKQLKWLLTISNAKSKATHSTSYFKCNKCFIKKSYSQWSFPSRCTSAFNYLGKS